MCVSAFGQLSRNHNVYAGQASLAMPSPVYDAQRRPVSVVDGAMPLAATVSNKYTPRNFQYRVQASTPRPPIASNLFQAPTAAVAGAMPSVRAFSNPYPDQRFFVGVMGSSCSVQNSAYFSPTYANAQLPAAQPITIQSDYYHAGTPAQIIGGGLGFESRPARVIEGKSNGSSHLTDRTHSKDVVAGSTDTFPLLQQKAFDAPEALVMLQQNDVESSQDEACYHITVTTLAGESNTFQCRPADTVNILKEKIYERMGHAQFAQKLILHEQTLEDDNSTLMALGIADGSLLTLVLDVDALQAAEAAEFFHERTMFLNSCFAMREEASATLGDDELAKRLIIDEIWKAEQWIYNGEVTVEEIRRRKDELRVAIKSNIR